MKTKVTSPDSLYVKYVMNIKSVQTTEDEDEEGVKLDIHVHAYR